MPLEGGITSDTLTINFIRSSLRALTNLFVLIPDVCFLASEFTSSFISVPGKWLKTFDTFTSKINGRCLWADTSHLSFIPDIVGRAITRRFRSG